MFPGLQKHVKISDGPYVEARGHWQMGQAFDSLRGYALGGEPARFCTHYGVSKTATFSTALYSEDGAHALALL